MVAGYADVAVEFAKGFATDGNSITSKPDLAKIFVALRRDSTYPKRTPFVAARNTALAEKAIRLMKRALRHSQFVPLILRPTVIIERLRRETHVLDTILVDSKPMTVHAIEARSCLSAWNMHIGLDCMSLIEPERRSIKKVSQYDSILNVSRRRSMSSRA
jgi:hypothetical protein